MPAATRIPLRTACRAFLAGDAAGNLLPLGLAASEPTKVLLTRDRLPAGDAIASLAIDNVIYLTTVLTVIAAGLAVLVIEGRLSFGPAPAMLLVAIALPAALSSLPRSVRRFVIDHPGRVATVFAIHMGFHALSVVEHYVTLTWLIGAEGATIGRAIVWEALNRVLTLAFKFVPFRVGVDEAASAELAALLGMAPAAGVATAIARKIRNLFWSGVGAALIGVRRGPAAPATDRP